MKGQLMTHSTPLSVIPSANRGMINLMLKRFTVHGVVRQAHHPELCRGAALVLLVLGSSGALWAQGARYDGIVLGPTGTPKGGATVTVCTATGAGTPCTPLAPIFSDSGLSTVKVNPFPADGLGNFGFFAAPGTYTYSLTGAGVTATLYTIVLPCVAGSNCAVGAGFTTLTFSATPALDPCIGSACLLTLAGNVTGATIGGGTTAGRFLSAVLCQDATGGRTFAWPAPFLRPPQMSSAANTCMNTQFMFDGTNWRQLATSGDLTTHFQAETHTGAETHSGAETHTGAETFTTLTDNNTYNAGSGSVFSPASVSLIDQTTVSNLSKQVLRLLYTRDTTATGAVTAFDALLDIATPAINSNAPYILDGIRVEGPAVAATKALNTWEGLHITAPSGAGTVTTKNSIVTDAGAGVASFGDGVQGKTVNNVRFADQFAGADAGAQINAAITDLPSTGGTVDARGFQGAQTISATVNVGLLAKPVVLLLGAATFSCTMASGDCFVVSRNSSIIGMGPGAAAIATTQINVTTNGVRAIRAAASLQGSRNITIRGLTLNDTAATRTSGEGIRVDGTTDAAIVTLEDIQIGGFFDGVRLDAPITSLLKRVRVDFSKNDGFSVYGLSTSTSFLSTYAVSSTRHGYYLDGGAQYFTFTGTASDSSGGDGYHMEKAGALQCFFLTFNAPGAEASVGHGMYFRDGYGHVINSPKLAGSSGALKDGIRFDGTGRVVVNAGESFNTTGFGVNALTSATPQTPGNIILNVTNFNSNAAGAINDPNNAVLRIGNVGTAATGTFMTLPAITFANLGTPPNGSVAYCSDCLVQAACAGGGTGALAKRLTGGWVCN